MVRYKREEKKIINYFFKEVVPQLLEYFKSNAKEMPELLILDVLKNNPKYEKDIQKVLELSKEKDSLKKGAKE